MPGPFYGYGYAFFIETLISYTLFCSDWRFMVIYCLF